MKRTTLVFAALGILAFAGIAHAGIGDWFTGIALGKTLSVIIGGLFTVLGMFWGGVALWKKPTQEGKDFALWIWEATRDDSPGGKKITGEELEEGLKEFGEFGQAVLAAIADRKAAKS